MTKKITALTDYICAQDAAAVLSAKLGRPVHPDYIRKLRNVRFVALNKTTKLYSRADIAAASIRKRDGAGLSSSR